MASRKILLKIITSASLWLLTSSLIFPNNTAPIWKNPPEVTSLANGLTVIYQRDDSSAITVLQILIKGGKGAEPKGKRGLAYLTTRLALEIPDRGKVQDLMNQASRVYMICKSDYSLINIACLSEHLEETLNIVSKIILKPLISGLRIDRIKKQMLHMRKADKDDSIKVGHNAALEKLFGDTAYGGSIYGNEQSLKAIKKKDIQNFYEDYFKAGNMIIAVSSDLEKDALIETLRKHFKKLPQGTPPQPEPMSSSIPEEKEMSVEKDTEQSLVSMAYPLPKITARNFALAYMLENLLGKGVNSRLWFLRLKEKLAYNVNARATQMKDGGILEAYLETENKKKDVALVALKNVLNGLFEKGLTEEELEVTKAYSKALFLRGNQTKETRTQNLAYFEAVDLGYEFLIKLFEEIDAITLEEINTYIKDTLNPEKGIEIIVGPIK